MTERQPLVFFLGAMLLGVMAVGVVQFWKIHQKKKWLARTSCIAELKQIDGAVQQWALEQRMFATDTYSLTDPVLLSFMRGSRLPVCLGGGTFFAGTNITNFVKCSLGETSRRHQLW